MEERYLMCYALEKYITENKSGNHLLFLRLII